MGNLVTLPRLNKLQIVKALLTFGRSKKKIGGDIHFSMEYKPITVDNHQLNSFCELFKSGEKQVTFWYLLAQRAQLACMLDSKYSLPIPGMIHLENSMSILLDINLDQPISIKCETEVGYKATGSLIPVLKVDFYQNNLKVLTCTSKYLVKRKSASKNRNRKAIELINDSKFTCEFEVNMKDAKKYAGISGDNNPIHVSGITAKLFGLQKPIIHGWYLVSKSIAIVENELKLKINSFDVEFIKPVSLPSKIDLLYNGNLLQLIIDDNVVMSIRLNF